MKACELQTTFGWNHFAKGRIVIEWGNIINDYSAKRNNPSMIAEQWGAKLLATNWNYILELWKLQNLAVHGDTPIKTETIHQTTMITEIIHIQNILTHLPLSDRELISRDETSLRAMSTSSIST
jgi:hypothetical protein